MKLRLSLIGVLLLIAPCLLILTGCPVPHPLCIEIVHLSFDGSLVDSSVYHHQVTATDTARYGQNRFGQRNKSLYLNGTTALSIPDTANLRLSNTFTISAWVRTRDTNDAGIVCKGPANNAVPGYRLDLKHGHPHAAITASGSNVDITATKSVADNVWHLLTLTASPAGVTLYLDTTVAGHASGTNLRADSMNTAPLWIGRLPNGLGTYQGYLDEIIIGPCPETLPNVIHQYRSSVANLADMPPGVMINPADTHTYILGMCWDDSLTGYCCGTHGTIEKTIDGGNSWTQIWIGTSEILRAISFKQGVGFAVGDNAAVFKFTDNGTVISVNPDHSATNLLINQGLSQIDYRGVKVFDATDFVFIGGAEWISGGIGFIVTGANGSWSSNTNSNSMRCMKCIGTDDNGTPGACWVAGDEGEIWKSTANGWVHDQLPTGGTATIRSCDFRMTSGVETGLVGTDDGHILQYNSSNGTWSPERGADNSWILGVQLRTIGGDLGVMDASGGGHVENLQPPWQQLQGSPVSTLPWVLSCPGSVNGTALLHYQSAPPVQIDWLH
ncbi:MAG: LamG-like jellyroll fold domain-containing protein [Bacteroidota bacterium]|nr:LamG-like jellyroll fold domain-containing protein [Bacteroidota bacterium]MDP4232027.1 LamG-like jellyroll fold domain-containing protein [Bacteroidota bacterium]MDP4241266.1 LamG-like jellyroll fold domain-containing protein [Bacteroidota bacterium]MDP4286658.1 LamG-like jellyroll fold domain-containing protein [Bacteroidota bacterium]